MATTSGGLPYPVGTDKVVDGDNAIAALAAAVDKKIQAGSAIVTTVAGNSDGYIPFPVAFKAGTVPIVIMQNGDPAATVLVDAFNQYTDNTRASFRLKTTAGAVAGAGNYRLQWHAIGVPA